MRWPLLVWLGAWLAVGALPCRAAYTARDDLGATVSLEHPARRVVALAPNAVELLYAVGAGKELVGAPAEADYPPEAARLPRTGSFSNPNEEALLALRPDLVVVAFGNPKALLDRLRARHTPTYVLHPRTVADVLQSMRSLGRLTGHDEGGALAAASFQKRLTAISRRLKGRPPVRAAILVWDDPITVAGSGEFLHDALRLAGGQNVAGDLKQPYPTLDPEQFAVRNPAAIVFAGHDSRRVNEAAARPGVRSTLAARSGRIFPVPEDLVLRAGPRLIEGIQAMARGLHPEAFRGEQRPPAKHAKTRERDNH